MTRFRAYAALLCAAAFAACDKNAVQDLTGPLPEARIMFFNFGIGAPPVTFYANDTKMTAIFSATGAESVAGTTYGNVAAGGFYTAIEPGQYTLSGRITTEVDKGTPISTLPATIEAGKHYSFYQSGVYNATTKTVDSFIVEDPFIEERDWSVAYVRFVNAIHNAAPMTLYAKNRDSTGVEVTIAGPVAYKSAGAFTAVPNGVYDLSTRYTGSGTNAITRTSVTFVAGRVYTVTARGDITSTSTTNRPFLDNTANR